MLNDAINNFFDKKDIDITYYLKKFLNKEFSIKFGFIGFIVITMVLNLITDSVVNITNVFLGESLVNIFSILNFINIFKLLPIYLVFWIMYIFVYIKFLMNVKVSFGELANGQKGSSRFATRDEIDQQYRAVPIQNETYSGGGGIPVARGYKTYFDNNNIRRKKEVMYIDDSAVNNLLIGTTRSGKGEIYIVPMIDIYSRAEKQPSMVVNDPKGELYCMSKEILEKRGYEIHVLNLLNPDYSMSYNPLVLIKEAYKREDYGEAQQLCNTLTYAIYHNEQSSEPMWEESSMALVNALILDLCDKCIKNGDEEKITLYTVANMLTELCKTYTVGANERYKIDDYFDKLPPTSVARMQYATVNFAQGKTKGSIFVTTMSKLQKFTFDKVARMTSKNTLDFKDVGFKTNEKEDRPKAIFMITSDYDESLHFIPSMYVQQLYYSLSLNATLKNGKCEREVKFILDEFGNMPVINGLASMITVCLGRNIRFDLVVQDYGQLKKKYGDDVSTIKGNCGNQIYILTNDEETSEQFSKLIGERTIVIKSRSGDYLSTSKNITESLDCQRLLKADELRSFKEGDIVVVRVIKRQDKERNKIVSYPIYNHDEYSMKYRYEYLNNIFNNTNINFIKMQEAIKSEHKDVDLEKISFNDIYRILLEEEKNKLKCSEAKNDEIALDALVSNTDIDTFNKDVEFEEKRLISEFEKNILTEYIGHLITYEQEEKIMNSNTVNEILGLFEEEEIKALIKEKLT